MQAVKRRKNRDRKLKINIHSDRLITEKKNTNGQPTKPHSSKDCRYTAVCVSIS